MSEKTKVFGPQPPVAGMESYKIYQTGYDTITMNIIRMAMQTAGTYTCGNSPLDETEYNDTTLTAASGLAHIKINQAGNPSLWTFITRCTATAWTIMNIYDEGSRPEFTFTDTEVAALLDFYEDMKAGLLKKKMPYLKHDNTAATTVAEILSGIDWEGATLEQHWTKLRMFFYAFGLLWREEFPKQSTRIDQQSQSETIFKHWVVLFLCKAMTLIYYYFVLAQGQTAHCIMKMAMAQGGAALQRYGDVSETPAFPDIVMRYLEEEKLDRLANITTTNLLCYTDNPLYTALIESENVNQIMYNIKDKFVVPKWSLHKARTNFGYGEFNGKHFFNFLCGAVEHANIGGTEAGTSQGMGDYHAHGASKFCVGIEESIHLTLMRKLKKYEIDKVFKRAIVNQKHYHFGEIGQSFNDIFVEYSFTKSLQGYAEPQAFLGAAGIFRFSAFASNILYVKSTEVVNDPHSLHSSSTLYVTSANFKNNLHALPALQGKIPDYYSLDFPNGVTMDELDYIIFWGALWSLKSSANWQNTRFSMRSYMLVEVIDAKNKDDKLCLAYSVDDASSPAAGQEVARYENVLDRVNNTTYPSIGKKYAHGLTVGRPAFERICSEPRPEGNKMSSTFTGIGELDDLQKLAMRIVAIPSYSAPKETADTPPIQPPDTKPDVIGKETEEESQEAPA